MLMPHEEEEAYFNFTLMDFQAVVSTFGVEYVIKQLNHETFEKLSEWFYKAGQPNKEVCKLLCSSPSMPKP